MRLISLSIALSSLFTIANAQTQRLDTASDGTVEGGWVVANPAGASDFFNTRYDSGSIHEEVSGILVSVADFGTFATGFPLVGLFRTNLAVDPTGRTPDLSNAVLSGLGTITPGRPLFDVQVLELGVAQNEVDLHAVVQFPPGDPGLLGVGADSDTTSSGGGESPGSSNPFDSSAFTTNGYTTAAATFDSLGEFSLGPAIAPGSQTLPALRLSTFDSNSESGGDFLALTTRVDSELGIGFWGVEHASVSTVWMVFISLVGVPLCPVTPLLPSVSTNDGISTHSRLFTNWPLGMGNMTMNFVAVSGAMNLIGSVEVSNEVTLYSLPDPARQFGVKDDGTYESGWVVQGSSGPSDYFSTPWGSTSNALSSSGYAILDFGTTVTSFPRAGQSPPNLIIDAAGNTPDLSNPYVDQPLALPLLTFVTTSGQLVWTTFPAYTPGTDVLEFIQYPPTDPVLLGMGADTNGPFIDGLAGWSIDGYNTPANLFALGNWGMRTQ